MHRFLLLLLLCPFLGLAQGTGGGTLPGGEGSGVVLPSKTLPVLHINTQDSLPIDQKEEYVPGTGWLEILGDEEFEPIGSEESPVALGIRGRGNSSWYNFDKKSYKIKFDKKQALLDMPKSKHWVLRAHLGPYLGYFPDEIAQWVGDLVGLPWTPHQHPVEVMLNGKYIGLYFLGESIRIESNRINIFEQPVDNQDPHTLSGGYLLELDNYEEDNQIVLQEPDFNIERFRVHTPEPFNQAQGDYLTGQLQNIIAAIYNPDKTSRDWEELLDADIMARFIVANEIVNNYEGFVGSCYMYKDTVPGAKWCMGPMWDVATGFSLVKETFCYQAIDYHSAWIDQLLQFPRLIAKMRTITDSLEARGWEDLYQGARDYGQSLKKADNFDRCIWTYLKGQPDMRFQGKEASRTINRNMQWIVDQMKRPEFTVYNAISPSDHRASISGHTDTVQAFAGMELTLSVDSAQVDFASFDGADITLALQSGPVKVLMPAHEARFEVQLSDLSAIPSLPMDQEKPIYFNLQGIPIPSPTTGIYILKRPGAAPIKVRKG